MSFCYYYFAVSPLRALHREIQRNRKQQVSGFFHPVFCCLCSYYQTFISNYVVFGMGVWHNRVAFIGKNRYTIDIKKVAESKGVGLWEGRWESDDEVTLITRPRRFRKTLNMSMIEQFFSCKYEGRGELFEGLDIWKDKKYQDLQGTYPVIALSFSDIKEPTFEGARKKICKIIWRHCL